MLVFSDCVLDAARFELRRRGESVPVEPQVFDLLCYLVEHRDRVVFKEELLDNVWGDRFVSDAALTSRIRSARAAIGDDGDKQLLIRTVRGRGYQFVGSVTLQPGQPQRAERTTSLPAETVRFCRAEDGVRIAYAVTENPTSLVKAANWMTHLGHDSTSPVWAHWLRWLRQAHGLVRYDERGCGLSEWNVPTFQFSDWVRDLEVVVDAAALDRFALLGISQGAAVAIAYAVRHPERVSRLVLIGGYAAGRRERAGDSQALAAAALDVELARVGWGQDDPSFRRVFATQFYPDGPPAMWDAFDELQRHTTSPANAARFLEAFAAVNVRALAPQVTCPTLLLHSRHDQRVPHTCAEELHGLIPRSRLVSLPSRNHLLTGDEPAWPVLMDEVTTFLH